MKNMPLTVCFKCLESLRSACDFVFHVEQAQEALILKLTEAHEDQIQIKIEEAEDNDNFTYEMKFEPELIHTEEHITKVKRETKKRKLNQSHADCSWKDFYWICGYCDTQFTTIAELNQHSIEYHKRCNGFRCRDCNTRKLRLSKFLTHVRRHKPALKLSCHICFTAFSSVTETHKHKTVHNISEHICIGCNTSFPSSKELDEHMQLYYRSYITGNSVLDSDLRDTKTCKTCNKKFSSQNSLSAHLLTHTDRKRDFICDICGKSYFNKQTLAGHVIVHSEDNPYTCQICKKSFKNKYKLKRHVATHNEEKPFACEECGKCFRLKRHLASHSIVHTDSLPFVCTYCDKAFRFRPILTQHIRQHTGEQPYSCEECKKNFTNWPNYNKHMIRKHGTSMSKKKPEPLQPVDSETGQIAPGMDKILEWREEILKRKKPKNGNNLEKKKTDLC